MNPDDKIIIDLIRQHGIEIVAKELNQTVEQVEDFLIDVTAENDFLFFANQTLYIEDSEVSTGERIVPFKLNQAQVKLLEAIERQRRANRPVRLVHLKPRQYGASTFFTGYIFRELLLRKNLHISTISYQYDSSEWIRGMASRFYDRYQRWKPVLKGRSDKTWKFPDVDSTWRIDSAENLQAGHSFSHQILHISELSRWEKDVSVLMRGLTSSIQAQPETMIFVESTANGYGDYFYDLWQRAKKGGVYEPVFISWLEIERYKLPFYDGKTIDGRSIAEFEKNLYPEEIMLRDKFGASLEQLHWRLFKIEGELKGSVEDFHEQFPSTDAEAFLSSGRPYFKITQVNTEFKRTEDVDYKRGYLEFGTDEKVEFNEDPHGWWKIFQLPKEGWVHRHVTGSDPAEGKDVGDENKDPDFSVCTVYDRLDSKACARFKARLDTDAFELEIFKASKFYDSACDCVESNNKAGGAVIKGLKSRDINLYRKELQGKTEDSETIEYGWNTSEKTREILLSELRQRIRMLKYFDDDNEFWQECSTFVYAKDGKPQAQHGAHDDVVFSSALAIQASLQASEITPIEKTEEVKERTGDMDVIFSMKDQILPVAEF